MLDSQGELPIPVGRERKWDGVGCLGLTLVTKVTTIGIPDQDFLQGEDKTQSSAGSLERNRDLGVSLGRQGAAQHPFLLQCGVRASGTSGRQQGEGKAWGTGLEERFRRGAT